jgi:hypothetical protein
MAGIASNNTFSLQQSAYLQHYPPAHLPF